ncbi:helix-turn-helix domain-containing protein [Clostridium senegalense]
MNKKHRISADDKIKYVQDYLEGKDSIRHISSSIGISAESFIMKGNKKYPKELKLQAVKDYLSGLGSQDDICIKYKIRSKAKLQQWISMYNSHNELKSYDSGGVAIMTKGRTTTYNERIDIVKYCIEHDKNYAKTAEKFQISYQQIYSWIKKYENNGIDALLDNRGKRKLESDMSELEKLKVKNKLLEAENRR